MFHFEKVHGKQEEKSGTRKGREKRETYLEQVRENEDAKRCGRKRKNKLCLGTIRIPRVMNNFEFQNLD